MRLHSVHAPLIAAVSIISSCAAPVGDVEGSPAPLINGDVAVNVYTGVARMGGGGCSAVLVAPRVMLTSAHCVISQSLQCTDIATAPRRVSFAEANGGWSGRASFDARTVEVRGMARRPELFDLSQCSSSDAYSCADPQRANVDHSKELVVLYLAADAPADVEPLPILIHPAADASHSAAEVGTISDLESWIDDNPPLVTTVGYGRGSHAYTLNSDTVRGRDFGIQRWIAASTDFAGALGNSDCNTMNAYSIQPGVVVSPDDLTSSEIGDANSVEPGESFDADQVHSGTGDSGGPILVGAGPSANGVFPDALPVPAIGDYDASRNYVAGTASLWVSAPGDAVATAFTPTWSYSASEFLMDALYDQDGDGYADPVDTDVDGDGCNNGIDQHPDEAFVPIGISLHVNCTPSRMPRLGHEGVDSDGDGLLNCADGDDDNDDIDDEDDPCDVYNGVLCYRFAAVCPWNPIFFDCRLGGCNELTVRLVRAVNPDPTDVLDFPIVSSSDYEIVVRAPRGMTIEESANALTNGRSTDTFVLDVHGREGLRGAAAAYAPTRVSGSGLRGANALTLQFSASGELESIAGSIVR